MALPLVNALPKFELTIPSTGKKVKARPYLVKEEKLLLLALESKDSVEMLNTMVETIQNCLEEPIDLVNLSTFDIEYLFIQLRSRSVGEVIRIAPKCQNEKCEETVDGVELNVNNIVVNVPKIKNIIELTDDISVELKWPTWKEVAGTNFLSDNGEMGTEGMFLMIKKCMKSINTPEEKYLIKDSTPEEIDEFINSLSASQLKLITDYIEQMPRLETTIEYTCSKCGHHSKLELKGLQDFF